MTQSKRNLIDKLMKLYPYSEEWFRSQPEKRLWAMYCAYKPKTEIVSQPMPDPTPTVSTIVENGDTYILTDAGVYEKMYD